MGKLCGRSYISERPENLLNLSLLKSIQGKEEHIEFDSHDCVHLHVDSLKSVIVP
jgi:hypothetical protein